MADVTAKYKTSMSDVLHVSVAGQTLEGQIPRELKTGPHGLPVHDV